MSFLSLLAVVGLTGGRNTHWYHIMFWPLCLVIVFPDKVLEEIYQRTGKQFGLWHLLVLELVAVVMTGSLLWWRMPIYPDLKWWYPVLIVGGGGLVRQILSWLPWSDEGRYPNF